jgi:hypothetical protein
MTFSNGSTGWGPRLPVVFCAHAIPAQQTEMRMSPAASTAAWTLPEPRAELLGERGPRVLVEIGDRDVGAGGVQLARGRRAQPRRAARDEGLD